MSRTNQMTEFDERVVAEAEADLDRLLSIEPSPEFAAKVRARVAAEQPARRWNWGRLGFVVAAACAVLVVVMLRSNPSVRDGGRPVPSARHEDVLLAADPATVEKMVVPSPAERAMRPRAERVIVVAQPEPEIIIDPAVTDAIRRLAAAARNTILDNSNGESIAADAHAGALPVAEPLKVPELVLSPADPNGGQ